MTFTSANFELHVRDLAAARRFYVDQLGLKVLQETAAINLLAVAAGGVRLSIFGDGANRTAQGAMQFTLATENLRTTIEELKQHGVDTNGPPVEAKDFMHFIMIHDPDGNSIGIAQYLRDPLVLIEGNYTGRRIKR